MSKRLLGFTLAAILLLPFVKGTAQVLLLITIISLALLALKHPNETFGCITLLAVIALIEHQPLIGSVAVGGLLLAGRLARRNE